MWVIPHAPFGIRDADRLEQLDGTVPGLALGHVSVGADHLRDLVADAIHGIERRHRILKDHRDALAAHGSKPLIVELHEVLTVEPNAPRDRRVGRPGEPEHGLRGDALARAGFAYDRQDFTRGQVERNPFDRAHGATVGGEADVEVLDGENHAGAASPNRMRGSRNA